ncbi:MAG: DNA repair protein RecO [Acidobacteriota bacterium]|nr:DNA repair protein RecO [Acidobacteriota bacterium]
MPIDQSEAIVLRSYHFGEQDKIVVFFTREKGVLRGVAKGARKFGNRFGSSLEPLSHVRIFYYEKERKDLVTISSADLLESFFEIQKDLETCFSLSYFAELIEAFSPSRAREDPLFRLLLTILRCLKDKGDVNFLSLYFESWFLKINGLLPDLTRCRKCRAALSGSGWLSIKKDGAYCDGCAPLKKEAVPADVGLFLEWAKKNPPTSREAPFSRSQLENARRALQGMIIYHLEREPKALRFLKGI